MLDFNSARSYLRNFQRNSIEKGLDTAYGDADTNFFSVLNQNKNDNDYMHIALCWAIKRGHLTVVMNLLTSYNLPDSERTFAFRYIESWNNNKPLDFDSHLFTASALLYRSLPKEQRIDIGNISKNVPTQIEGLFCAYACLRKRKGVPKDIGRSILRSTPLGYALMPPANIAATVNYIPCSKNKKQRIG